MDAPSSMSAIQLLLFGTLLATLVLWMVTFLVLALRPSATKAAAVENETITYAQPSLSKPTPMMVQVAKVQQRQVPAIQQSDL